MAKGLRQHFYLQNLGERISSCQICNKEFRYWNDGHENATCGDIKCIEKLVKSGKCSITSVEHREYMEYCSQKARNNE